ncbi:MAG: DUF5698 domain-containing protein [bacterium]|nr:DUF5698 domain-containing protein [bacterium]
MTLQLLAYFCAGVLQDFLFTLNIKYVAVNKIVLAMLTSFLITIVNLVVLYSILSALDSQQSIPAIIVYALGIATGTLLGMKLKIGKN